MSPTPTVVFFPTSTPNPDENNEDDTSDDDSNSSDDREEQENEESQSDQTSIFPVNPTQQELSNAGSSLITTLLILFDVSMVALILFLIHRKNKSNLPEHNYNFINSWFDKKMKQVRSVWKNTH